MDDNVATVICLPTASAILKLRAFSVQGRIWISGEKIFQKETESWSGVFIWDVFPLFSPPLPKFIETLSNIIRITLEAVSSLRGLHDI